MDIVYAKMQTWDQANQAEMLNRANELEHLDPKVAEEQGFLTILYSAEKLMRMTANTPPAIALRNNQVVGFLVLNSPVRHLDEHAAAMHALSRRIYKGKPLSQYQYVRCGPACVSSVLRGQGVARGLYDFVARQYPFDILVIRINQTNLASIKVHEKIGFREFDREKGKVTWLYMAKELHRSRL